MWRVLTLSFLLLWPGLASPATTPVHCFGLSFLAADVDDPQALIDSTYGRLFDELGVRMSPATLTKMIEAKDPYAVPEQGDTDLGALRGRVRELRDMLITRGWLTPETRATLLAHLASRIRSNQEQQVVIDKATRETVRGFVIQMPSAIALRANPAGRYVTTMMTVGRGQGRTVTYDLQARDRIEGTFRYAGGLIQFSADGTHIVYDKGGQLYRVAFDAGQPRWDKAESIGSFQENIEAIVPAADGLRFYTRRTESPKTITSLSTLNGGPTVKLDLHLDGSRDWGNTAAGDGLWYLSHRFEHGLVASEYTVSPTGEARAKAYWTFENGNLTNALWSSDGKRLIGYGSAGNSAIELVTASRPTLEGARPPVQRLDLPADPGGGTMQILDAKVHPKANKVAFLMLEKSNRRRVVWYDMNTGASLGGAPVPEMAFTKLVMDPSGKHFLLGSVEGHVYVGNLDSAPQ